MKKTLLLLFFVLAAFVSVQAQSQYPLITLHDLNYVPQDSLAIGHDASPYLNDTVRVTGVVMVRTLVHPDSNRKQIMWAGNAAWQCYIRDTAYGNTEWTGLCLYQADTVSSSSILERVDTGKVYTFTGVVVEFGYAPGFHQTELSIIKTFPAQYRGNKGYRAQPIEVPISDFATGTTPKYTTGERWEGTYVIIRNVFTTDRTTSTSAANPFAIIDADGNKIYVHGQSGYFTKRAYSLRTWDPPTDGSALTYIRGVIGQNSDGSYVIRPMYPDDIQIGSVAPVTTSIKRDKVIITPTQTVVVTAKIRDYNTGATVTNAELRYRVNGGARLAIAMTQTNDSMWTATIPATTIDSALVDYYIYAKNSLNVTSVTPTDTTKNIYFYLSMTRTALTIKDIQYSPFGGGYTAYQNFQVTVTGVVSADIHDLEGDGGSIARRAYIQDGTGPWSGVQIFGTAIDALVRGQKVTVTGWSMRQNSNTRLDTITAVVISSGNPIPDAQLINTSDIATVTMGTVAARKWEGVMVKYANVKVTAENADGNPGPSVPPNYNYGEMMVADASNVSTRCELQEGNHHYHNLWIAGLDTVPGNIRVRTGDKFTEVRGVFYYAFSNYKIVPRIDADFIGYTSDVKEISSHADGYALSQNYPNPFNPATVLNYSIPKANHVTVKVFNLLGQEIRTLVDMEQNAGTYKVVFDASNMPTGIYLYKIQAGDYSEVKKMMLVK